MQLRGGTLLADVRLAEFFFFHSIRDKEIVECGSSGENDARERLTDMPSEFRMLMVAP